MIVKEEIVWELDPSSRYDLHDAYGEKPHHEFVRADDDEKQLKFLRTWGPFAFELRATQGRNPLEFVRQQQYELKAWTRLFAAIEDSAGSHEPDSSRPWTSLRRCLIDVFRLNADGLAIPIRGQLGMPPGATFGEIEARLAHALDSELDRVCDSAVLSFPAPQLSDALVIERHGGERHVRAAPLFLGLRDALNVMVLQDIRSERPFSYCAECGRLIESETRHVRRFCDIRDRPCARKWTDRNWKSQKRHPERQKREQEAARAEKGKPIGSASRRNRTQKKGKS
jgi:hypothetical protein